MRKFRIDVVLLSAVLMVALPIGSWADGRARDRGEIHGTIRAVDYGSEMLVVRTAKGRERVAVSPSTQIYVHGHNASLAEVHDGNVVDIFVSDIDGHLVAQIIRIP